MIDSCFYLSQLMVSEFHRSSISFSLRVVNMFNLLVCVGIMEHRAASAQFTAENQSP